MQTSPAPNPVDETQQEILDNKTTPRRSLNIPQMVKTVLLVGVVLATLFTMWNPHSVFSAKSPIAILPTPVNIENASAPVNTVRIGIHSGHYKHDEGNVCPDGIREVDVAYVIANKTSLLLAASGITVEILNEYDLRLINYKADALISIQTGSCTDASAAISGFKIGTSLSTPNLDQVNALSACLAEEYQLNTGLMFGYRVVTDDEVDSHTFLDVNPQTPVVLLETGSLAVDRAILIDGADRAANGITAGILCYLKSQQLIK